MNQDELDKIANLSSNISFLAWDLEDDGELPKNGEKLNGKEWQQHPEHLHTKYIFVGLNPSGEVKKLENLHKANDSGNNCLRQAAFRTCFWGSLFMDLDPATIEGSSKKVKVTQAALVVFINTLDAINKILPFDSLQLVCFGKACHEKKRSLQEKIKNTFPNVDVVIHHVWHYTQRGEYEAEYKKLFQDFDQFVKKHPGQPFIPTPLPRKKSSSGCLKKKSSEESSHKSTNKAQMSLEEKAHRQKLQEYAERFLQEQSQAWELKYQKTYRQFHIKKHSDKCQIRIGQNGHFMDLLLQGNYDNWEQFLDQEMKNAPGQWDKIKSLTKSQLVPLQEPTNEEEVRNLCKRFYELSKRYKDLF